MNKIFFSTILIGLSLASCSNQSHVLSIVSPTGAPALAFYKYAGDSNFDTNSNPTNIVAMMASGQKDVVILPTNAGMQAIINKNAPYQIAATITFGNFYIASLNNDDNNVMDTNDTILLFQKNNVPDKVFHYIYGEQFDASIHYVNAVSDAASALLTGSFVTQEGKTVIPNYVMVAEPVLTTVLNKKENVSVYANIQEEYRQKSNNQEMFQASVFIKNSVGKEIATSFLNQLQIDINDAINNPSLLKTGMNKLDNAQQVYGIAPEMAEAVMKKDNGMGLGYKAAKENKEAIENFLSIFGIKETNEKDYF